MKVKGAAARERTSKIGVVLGGGGITGGVFEVGALKALDLALGGGVVTSADCYAGASAGSLVAMLLAAGLTPDEMEDVLVRGARNRRRLPPLRRTSVYGLDFTDWIGSAARLPLLMTQGFVTSLLPGESSRPADAFFEALQGLPAGLFTNRPMEAWIEEILRKVGAGRTFESLEKDLFVTAVNLDTGTRITFGEAGIKDVPIARAIRASAAVPLLFKPVRIDDQDFVDGGVERNLPVDVVVKQGVSLVIAINPMVPLVNDPRSDGGLLRGHRHLADQGLPAVLDQVFRMLIRSQVMLGLQRVRQSYPEVDIVLIEPEAHDWRMFSYHPMRYSVRQDLATHAFRMTRDRLVRDDDELTRLFARHGLTFDVSLLGQPSRRERATKAAKSAGRWVKRLEQVPGLGRLLRGDSGDTSVPF